MSSLTPQPVPVRRQGFEPDGSERWYVLVGEEQCGPFPAAEMAKRLDSGAIEWSTSVWRQGFKDWRPARRDAVLVTSVAGERGFGSDTLRLHSASSFVANEDTVVDHAPPQHDTVRLPGPPEFEFDERSSAPPPPPGQRPQTAAPGAALGQSPDARTSSSSTLIRLGPYTLRVPHSVISVGAVSFAAGVLAAALWARFLGRPEPIEVLVVPGAEETLSAEAAVPADSEGSAVEADESGQTEAAAAVQPRDDTAPEADADAGASVEALQPTAPRRALPKTAEIREALRTVAPAVRSCLAHPKQGVDTIIYLDGPSGRVRDVQLRGRRLGPVRARCVVHAIRGLQIEPFERSELPYPYRFAW